MRRSTLATLVAAGSVMALAACTQQAPESSTLSGQTGSVAPAQQTGGLTFQAPSNVPASAYTGSERGTSNSPLGATFQAPTNIPPGAYTGSERGTSNSPLGFQRNTSQMPGQMPGATTPAR